MKMNLQGEQARCAAGFMTFSLQGRGYAVMLCILLHTPMPSRNTMFIFIFYSVYKNTSVPHYPASFVHRDVFRLAENVLWAQAPYPTGSAGSTLCALEDMLSCWRAFVAMYVRATARLRPTVGWRVTARSMSVDE